MRIWFEHVGLAYLATVRDVLRPGGLFLNHSITHNADGWNKTVATKLINRDVFPDGGSIASATSGSVRSAKGSIS